MGIGKMIFNTPDVPWNIPYLHFLVDAAAPGRFEATVLEFGLVSAGASQEEAIERLAAQAHAYIFSVMERDDYGQLIECVNDFVMEDYWRQYRVVEFSLARQGNDLSHDMDKTVERAVKAIINEKTDQLLDGIAKNNAREYIEEAKRMVSFASAFDFEYKTVRASA